ncbi:MAG: DotU family type IV/VI secretion system protein [Pseudomonadota bacterium]
MKSEAWDYLYLYFSALDEIFLQFVGPYENAQSKPIAGASKGHDSSTGETLDLLPICEKIEENIKQCHSYIKPLITKKELKYLISALIFHCDETVVTKKLDRHCIPKKSYQWPSIQKKIAHCQNGGERFFRYLDEMLLHSRNYSLAIEVYFFCLSQGFVGCYFDDPEKIKAYLKRCTDAISIRRLRI